MRRHASLLLTFALTLALILTAAHFWRQGHGGHHGPKGPALLVDHETLLSAPVLQGQTAHFRVPVLNGGTQELRVAAVRPGCSCTLSEPTTPFTVPPGEEVELRLAVRTTELRGEFAIPVLISSNAGNAPEQQFHIKGRVTPALRAEPELLQLGTVDLSANLSIDVTVYPEAHFKGSPITTVHVPAALAVAAADADPATGARRFTFTIQGDPTVLAIEEDLEFEVAGRDGPARMKVPLRILGFGQCRIDPYPLNCGAIQARTRRQLTCQLRFRETVSDVEALAVGAAASNVVVTPDGERVYRLDVDVSATTPGPLVRDHVIVRFVDADGRGQTLRIPLIGVVY